MGEAYEVHDIRFVQVRTNISVADALYTFIGPVPDNQIWTIRAATAKPSVNETRTWWFGVQPRGLPYAIPVTQPASLAVVVASQLQPAFLREGMEFRLYPGENFFAFRDAATAGSTIEIWASIIETDIPFYEYIEPQERRRLRRSARGIIREPSIIRGGGGSAGGVLGFPVGGQPPPRPK